MDATEQQSPAYSAGLCKIYQPGLKRALFRVATADHQAAVCLADIGVFLFAFPLINRIANIKLIICQW